MRISIYKTALYIWCSILPSQLKVFYFQNAEKFTLTQTLSKLGVYMYKQRELSSAIVLGSWNYWESDKFGCKNDWESWGTMLHINFRNWDSLGQGQSRILYIRCDLKFILLRSQSSWAYKTV